MSGHKGHTSNDISNINELNELEYFLKFMTPGYQKVTLPSGISIGGISREKTAEIVFHQDVRGKSVLDVGCDIGYFCFEAVKRGAKKVVGVDVDPYRITVAKKLAKYLNAPVEFRVMDIEKQEFNEEFDIVICLNVLHHLKDPILALDKLAKITREVLILEVAGINRRDMAKIGIGRVKTLLFQKNPIIVVSRDGLSGKCTSQKFFISKEALKNLLLYHRNNFAKIDIIDSEFKNRYIAIGYKRKINKLLLIAGPTSVGKTTLIRRILKGEEMELIRRLGLDDISNWRAVDADQLDGLDEKYIENLILHYDILRPWGRGPQVYEKDEALDLLDCSSHVIILTLWASPEVLVDRLVQGELEGIIPSSLDYSDEYIHDKLFSKHFLQKKVKNLIGRGLAKIFGCTFPSTRHIKIYFLYRNPSFIYNIYEEWLSFCEDKTKYRWILDVTRTPFILYREEEWKEKVLNNLLDT